MQYNNLGNNELSVSEICLGTMTFGEQNTEREAHAQLDLALEYGVNFIDTAEMYAIPPKAETYGRTEEMIGNWLQKTGKREDLIIASKVIGQAEWMPHVRDGKACLNRENIQQAIEGSLQRLQTDYLDLYQVHWPDRQTNFFGKLGYAYAEERRLQPQLRKHWLRWLSWWTQAKCATSGYQTKRRGVLCNILDGVKNWGCRE